MNRAPITHRFRAELPAPPELEHCGLQDPTSWATTGGVIHLPALIPETSGRFVLRWRCRECSATFKRYAAGSNHLTRRHS